MVSNTQQTKSIRARRRKSMGRRRKRLMRSESTPVFPIHQPGYDPSAPDAPGSASSQPSVGGDDD